MAEQFPIDPEFGRFVGGQPTDEDAEAGVEVELDLDDSELEELPDGSVVVSLDTKGPVDNPDFYENLADNDMIDGVNLSSIALRYIKLIEKDKQARKERDKQYEEGIKRTGLGHDAPGGANFEVQARLSTRSWPKPALILPLAPSKNCFPLTVPPEPRSWVTLTSRKWRSQSVNATT
jgi:hypothetical protein